MEHKITPKQMMFAYYYSKSRNLKDAVAKAGFLPFGAEKRGLKLMESQAVREQLRVFDSETPGLGDIYSGLCSIAFSSVSDPFKLLFLPESGDTSVVDGLDLSSVSEIKRVKGGGIEMKFYDRIKALEKLFSLIDRYQTSESSLNSLFDALARSGQASRQPEEDDLE